MTDDMTHPPVEHGELGLLAHHAVWSRGVWDPDCGALALARRLLAAPLDEVLDALFDVGHPLLLLGGRGGVHGERLSPRADQPAVHEDALVLQRPQLHLFERNDVLLVVFLLADDDVAVHQEVVEEEELPGFGLLPAGLCEHALADEHPAGHGQGLSRGAETALDQRDPPGVRLAVHCNQKERCEPL